MYYTLLAILLLAAPHGAFALTWDFDEGTTWGWTAHEGTLGIGNVVSPTTVYSEVAEGVWRIAPVPGAQRPVIHLLSPLIGEDSALFDQVTLRLRIVHDRPTEGDLLMEWSNVESRRLKKEAGQRGLDSRAGFFAGRGQLYPTEWENTTIDIRALEAAAEAIPAGELEIAVQSGEATLITWQDTLFHFTLELNLNKDPQGPDDHPIFLEVDWIQLTGAEEVLLGELQPREIAVEAGLPGALFAEPRFSVLGEGIGTEGSQGVLGDVDGDGDADLVVIWEHYRSTIVEGESIRTTRLGWTVASSDGLGGFVPTQEVPRSSQDGGASIRDIAGGDFDGDGLLDLAYSEGFTIELWHNRGKNGFETILQLSDVFFLGLADGDGDGDVDLLGVEMDDIWSNVSMWINDGAAGFDRSDWFALDSEGELFPRLLPGQPLGEAVYLLWNRVCYKPSGPWQLTQPWAASQQPTLFFEAAVNPCDLHLLTDLDGDDEVELVGSPDRNLQFDFYSGTTHHGLALWRVGASGMVVRHTLLGPQVLLPHRAIASDLNGDGLLDLAVVDGNRATGPSLVVLAGQRNGVPVLEGRYPLPGTGRQVLAGDVNGDGATDLVVLGRSVEGGPGGAFAFINQGVPATAIAAETTPTPTAFVLGANYPNPFNPATTIPLTVPAGAGDVDVAIYNVLGQPVRQVWAGPLAAGKHRLAWDGRDAEGQPVAAGVYVVRLRQGDQTRIRKMVKLE